MGTIGGSMVKDTSVLINSKVTRKEFINVTVFC